MSMLPTKSLVELQALLTYVQSANGFSQFVSATNYGVAMKASKITN